MNGYLYISEAFIDKVEIYVRTMLASGKNVNSYTACTSSLPW